MPLIVIAAFANALKPAIDAQRRLIAQAVRDFLSKTDHEGRPEGERRHWLTFARGISIAQFFGNRITSPEMREIWDQTEHYWRERLFDVLEMSGDSFPPDYYGYMKDDNFIKNFAFSPGERAPIAEQSAAFIYRWVKWPEHRPDPLDRTLRFSDEELEVMELFGPRGIARYVQKLRAFQSSKK